MRRIISTRDGNFINFSFKQSPLLVLNIFTGTDKLMMCPTGTDDMPHGY